VEGGLDATWPRKTQSEKKKHGGGGNSDIKKNDQNDAGGISGSRVGPRGVVGLAIQGL